MPVRRAIATLGVLMSAGMVAVTPPAEAGNSGDSGVLNVALATLSGEEDDCETPVSSKTDLQSGEWTHFDDLLLAASFGDYDGFVSLDHIVDLCLPPAPAWGHIRAGQTFGGDHPFIGKCIRGRVGSEAASDVAGHVFDAGAALLVKVDLSYATGFLVEGLCITKTAVSEINCLGALVAEPIGALGVWAETLVSGQLVCHDAVPSNAGEKEQPLPGVDDLPPVEDLVPDVELEPSRYPSNDCTGPAVVDGYVGGTYLKVRAQSEGSAAVCVAVDDGSAHRGGKINLGPGPIAGPDDDHEACDADEDHRMVNGDGFLGPLDFDVDVNVRPAEEIWVCVYVLDTLSNATLVAKRFVAGRPEEDGPILEPDLNAPYPYERSPNAQPVSGSCQGAPSGWTPLLDADVGTGHLWFDTLSDTGGTRLTACGRVENIVADRGARVAVDGEQIIDVENTSDFSECDFPVAGLPPTFEVRAHIGAPTHLCLGAIGISRQVVVDPGGAPTAVDLETDDP